MTRREEVDLILKFVEEVGVKKLPYREPSPTKQKRKKTLRSLKKKK